MGVIVGARAPALRCRGRVGRMTTSALPPLVEGRGRLVLAGAPLGRPDDASPRLARGAGPGGRGRRGGHPPPRPPRRRPRRHRRQAGWSATSRATRPPAPPGCSRTWRPGAPSWWSPTAGCPACPTRASGWSPRRCSPGSTVTCVPGPSAVTTALAVSGLPSDRFCFEGFLPRAGGPRRRRIGELATEPRTLVLFESPRRVGATLADLASAFGADRPAAVCRELTKTYEEVRRGGLGELATWAADGLRGEVTLVVGGAPPVEVVAEPGSPGCAGRGPGGSGAAAQGGDRRGGGGRGGAEAGRLRRRRRRQVRWSLARCRLTRWAGCAPRVARVLSRGWTQVESVEGSGTRLGWLAT